MRNKLLLIGALMSITFAAGVTGCLRAFFPWQHAPLAAAAPKPMPAAGISVSVDLQSEIATWETFQAKVRDDVKATNLQPEMDRLTGMTNRINAGIDAEMQKLKLSPNDYAFQQDCRCFVPKPKPPTDLTAKPEVKK